jgi:hypothetical protein
VEGQRKLRRLAEQQAELTAAELETEQERVAARLQVGAAALACAAASCCCIGPGHAAAGAAAMRALRCADLGSHCIGCMCGKKRSMHLLLDVGVDW